MTSTSSSWIADNFPNLSFLTPSATSMAGTADRNSANKTVIFLDQHKVSTDGKKSGSGTFCLVNEWYVPAKATSKHAMPEYHLLLVPRAPATTTKPMVMVSHQSSGTSREWVKSKPNDVSSTKERNGCMNANMIERN